LNRGKWLEHRLRVDPARKRLSGARAGLLLVLIASHLKASIC
jgi:hypothetical protein